MKERFEGDSGRRLLLDAINEQKFVAGTSALAEAIMRQGQLLEVRVGETIIEQGLADNDVYLILAGSFRIVVNGRNVATRFSRDHVGEMAAIQPSLRRSATVLAAEDSVVLKLSEPAIAELANMYPQVWRFFAKELARRLEQRNSLIRTPHSGIRIFVASSVEAVEVARAVQNAFGHDPYVVAIWTDDVFGPSEFTIEGLQCQLDDSDFAVVIAHADDVTQSRGVYYPSPRDNVIFELGLFMGRLGRRRTFLLEPLGNGVKLPSDLLGLGCLSYAHDQPRDLAAAVGPACNQIRSVVEELGPNL